MGEDAAACPPRLALRHPPEGLGALGDPDEPAALQDEQQAGPFRFLEVAQIYRDRWGIESFFKLVKQYVSFDHLISRCEKGIEVMLYMTLILTWLLMWYQRKTGIDRGWRSVQSWLAHDVESWVQIALRKAKVMPVKPLPKDAYANST